LFIHWFEPLFRSFAVQHPHPPGLNEHAEKFRISKSEVEWLHYEKSVRLVEGEDAEDSSREDSDSEVGSDYDYYYNDFYF
jgi:hypothetical protein